MLIDAIGVERFLLVQFVEQQAVDAVGLAPGQPLPPQAELGWWYQYYFATERGRAASRAKRQDA